MTDLRKKVIILSIKFKKSKKVKCEKESGFNVCAASEAVRNGENYEKKKQLYPICCNGTVLRYACWHFCMLQKIQSPMAIQHQTL